ncbi:hypothetical protein POM88_006422 [Heracleum sosnowskyi]|uniref:Uncharacterized protein n=1 Tax=Heracleum sosnowskyi TaxID=360622 RepID=A0AAD8N4Q9_9APIA|nr:hypothetical protein POM88_006422 [Heracleum sosnowskyi]
MADSNSIIVNNKDNQEQPSFPNPFISLFTNFTKFFNFPQPKSNPEPKVAQTAPVAENTKSKAPVVATFPNKQTVAPLKLEAEDLEKTTNPVVVWQVYAIGGFFVLKWAWARYNERRARKKTNDEDPPPADE